MTPPDDPTDADGPDRADAAVDLVTPGGSPGPDGTDDATEGRAAGAGVDQDGDEDGDEPAEPAETAETAESARSRRVRSAIEWVAVLAGAVVIALVVRTFLFTTFWIPSGSMEPTLQGEGRRDRVVVNRLAYRFGEPERGDIIVFEVPEGEPSISIDGQPVRDLIKRIVGLPGETVELRDGDVFIDGERLDEPYLPDGTRTDPASPDKATFVVPDDAVFVLGDNRGASRDARYWQRPWVPEDDIVGEAFVRIWPLSAFGGI